MKKHRLPCMNRRDFLGWSSGVAAAAASFPLFPGEFAHAEPIAEETSFKTRTAIFHFKFGPTNKHPLPQKTKLKATSNDDNNNEATTRFADSSSLWGRDAQTQHDGCRR